MTKTPKTRRPPEKESKLLNLHLVAVEASPDQKPRIISDNGYPYTSQDFREFINILASQPN